MTSEYLATGDGTGPTFGLYRWTVGEGESGPEPHFHRSITESFYVLSGEVRLYDGQRWVTGRAGDFLFVPEGGVHGFRGSARASMLLLFAPGAPREDYVETLAARGPAGPPTRRSGRSSCSATTRTGSDGPQRNQNGPDIPPSAPLE